MTLVCCGRGERLSCAVKRDGDLCRLLADPPLRSRFRRGKFLPAERPVVANGAAGCRVALFPGCMTDNLYPEQGQAIVRALRGLGVQRALP